MDRLRVSSGMLWAARYLGCGGASGVEARISARATRILLGVVDSMVFSHWYTLGLW